MKKSMALGAQATKGAKPSAMVDYPLSLTHWGRDKMDAIFQTMDFLKWKCTIFD